MQMKALTVHQPWASILALGMKEFETRSWSTKYRGPIAIHAGKTSLSLFEALDCSPSEFLSLKEALEKAYPDGELPVGCVVAVAELVEVFPTEDIRENLSSAELAVGDYSDGRFAWKLDNIRPLAAPVPAIGKHRLWELELE